MLNLSRLLDGFVYVATCICQSCSKYFLPNKAELKLDQDSKVF